MKKWNELAKRPDSPSFRRYRASSLRRMWNASEFIKTFKELFNVWYKRERGYSGSIWDGRFKSTLVEDGRYRAICMRYVYLNPVRAGMVKHATDYAWSWIATFDSTSAGSCLIGIW